VPGHVVAGRYRLIRELGEGGMGVVWVARSLVLDVDVAIKLIRAGRADPELASRMAREAQVTASLGHPAIVRVFDFGTTDRGDPFLVMELAHGETLAALIRRERRIDAVQAVRLILPIVDALRCAHERGIIHRDIKPENVFVARDNLGRVQPKLLDFGIAMLEHHPSISRLTQLGEVLGSPEFMSPEQARGSRNVDLRTDVWALCVVLYDLLTGTVPFPATNYNAMMQAILHQAPSPITEYGAGDRDLWMIIAKGLAKAREKRWTSMSELGEALALWLFDRGISEDVAGNSLKAMWLSGAPANAEPSAVGQGEPAVGAAPVLVGHTLRLYLRRWRHRAEYLLMPTTRRAAVAAALLVLVPLVLWVTVGRRADARNVSSNLPVPAVAPPPAPASPDPPPAAAAPEPPPAATSAPKLTVSKPATKGNRVNGTPSRPSSSDAHPNVRRPPRKSIRNFGF
jgi:serine/threonine-protein kinase